MKKLLVSFFVCFSMVFSGMIVSCSNPSSTPVVLPATTPTTTTPTTDQPTNTPDPTNPTNPEQPTQQPTTSYTVSFVTDGGSTVDSQSVTSGNKATRPANPTKTGCTFAGWYTSNAYTTAFDFDTAITANTVLYAKWDIAAGYFKVTYNANGGTLGTTYTWVSVQSGTSLAAPAVPTKENAIFSGWYTESECTNAFAFPHTITQSVTLYAKWTPAGTVNLNLADITMSTTENPGCYTFTISPALHARYQQNAALLNSSLRYSYIIVGQGLVFKSNQIQSRHTTSNIIVCKQTLEKDGDYRLYISVELIGSNITELDRIIYDFKG